MWCSPCFFHMGEEIDCRIGGIVARIHLLQMARRRRCEQAVEQVRDFGCQGSSESDGPAP